jgi:ketosteroid isomerase-like protein
VSTAPQDIVAAYFAACNAHDVARIVACHHPDAVNYDSCRPGHPVVGREAIGRLWERVFTRLPDIRWSEDRVLAVGDEVVVEWTLWATLPGHGPITLSGCDVYHVRDGLIANVRQYWDASLFRAAGELRPAADVDWTQPMLRPFPVADDRSG